MIASGRDRDCDLTRSHSPCLPPFRVFEFHDHLPAHPTAAHVAHCSPHFRSLCNGRVESELDTRRSAVIASDRD